jgi:hypothetical protein
MRCLEKFQWRILWLKQSKTEVYFSLVKFYCLNKLIQRFENQKHIAQCQWTVNLTLHIFTMQQAIFQNGHILAAKIF